MARKPSASLDQQAGATWVPVIARTGTTRPKRSSLAQGAEWRRRCVLVGADDCLWDHQPTMEVLSPSLPLWPSAGKCTWRHERTLQAAKRNGRFALAEAVLVGVGQRALPPGSEAETAAPSRTASLLPTPSGHDPQRLRELAPPFTVVPCPVGEGETEFCFCYVRIESRSTGERETPTSYKCLNREMSSRNVTMIMIMTDDDDDIRRSIDI